MNCDTKTERCEKKTCPTKENLLLEFNMSLRIAVIEWKMLLVARNATSKADFITNTLSHSFTVDCSVFSL